MSLQPLAHHRREVHFGAPLPFGICDAEGRLLLAQGQLIESEHQLELLLDRGAFIDRSGRASALHQVAHAQPKDLPGLWNQSVEHIGRLLRACVGHPNFTEALDAEADPLIALVQRDPDLAIFRIVHLDAVRSRQYAARHAVHAAIAGHLAARRLGASRDEQRCLFRAALTMNLSIVDLQNLLANQEFPVSATQRQQIRSHPERSVQMLQAAGVTDPAWLQAVAQHHETGGTDGYPGLVVAPTEAAQLLHRSDVFTAKFGVRAQRPAMAADLAVRSTFQRDQGHPMTAALIKEFSLYPPGTVVRLASGELGVVVRRTDQASAPIVQVLVGRSGEALITPVRRVTGTAGHGITAVLPASALRSNLPLDLLVSLTPH